jgi:hypothetical protein
MSYKREMVFIIHYVDGEIEFEKYAKNIYNDYVKRTQDHKMTYDRFRYIFKKSQFDKLIDVVKIEKYNFEEFLQPFFNRALENINLRDIDKDTSVLSNYTRNKVFNNIKRLFETKEYNVSEYDFTKPLTLLKKENKNL